MSLAFDNFALTRVADFARRLTHLHRTSRQYLVDDDQRVLKALSLLLHARGYDARPFSSSRKFLAQHDATVPGCAIFDLSIPDLDGLQLQEALEQGAPLGPTLRG